MKMKMLISIVSFAFICLKLSSQELLRKDTIGKFEIIAEKEQKKLTVLSKYNNKIDTVWQNSKGLVPIDYIHTMKIFDQDKFVLIYSTYSAYIYLLKKWEEGKWVPVMTHFIIGSPPSMPASIEVVNYNTLKVRQNNVTELIDYDMTLKTQNRRIIQE